MPYIGIVVYVEGSSRGDFDGARLTYRSSPIHRDSFEEALVDARGLFNTLLPSLETMENPDGDEDQPVLYGVTTTEAVEDCEVVGKTIYKWLGHG